MSTVVVRVKRKIDEDPPDLLDLFAKKSRKESVESNEKCITDIKTTLQFAGTVPSQDSSVEEPIRRAMRKQKLEREYKHHAPDTYSMKRRQLRRLASEKNRYSLVSGLRNIEKKSALEDYVVTQNRIPGNLDVVQLIDLEQDGCYKSPMQVLSDASAKTSTVTCNGVPMIREKVDDSKVQACSDPEQDFVYDVYYAYDQLRAFCDIEDVFKVEAFREDYMFSEYRTDSDYECYDDEDDSNDENNWRNDYPDEPDYLSYPDLAKPEAEELAHSDLWDDMARKVNLTLGADDEGCALDVYGSELPALGTYEDFKCRVLAEVENLTDSESEKEPPEDSEGISGLL